MNLCRKGWIGHVPPLNGEILFSPSLSQTLTRSTLRPQPDPYHNTTTQACECKGENTKKIWEIWATHPDCETIIQTSWEADVLLGSPMARLFEKIKRCRFALLDWSRTTFGHSQTQLKEK